MLNIQQITANTEQIIHRLSIKGFNETKFIYDAIKLDKERRQCQQQLDDKLSVSKQVAAEIGKLFKEGNKEEAEKARSHTAELKKEIQALTEQLKRLENDLKATLTKIPNPAHEEVKAGKSEEDNEVLSVHGQKPDAEKAIPHWDITNRLKLIDFEAGNKISGAGFPVYTGKGAKLQRALISYFLDKAEDAGYTEFQPPLLVNEKSAFGTGQLPDKDGQMYHIAEDDLYIIPTAEVPLTNIYSESILNDSDLPVKIVGYTPCFRREAGSYGKNVRGLNRLHQFDKVEIVQIVNPETSYLALEEMKSYIASLLNELGLHYRVLRLCGGDLGFAAALTFDFEVYAAGQKRWLEVSSVSNFEAFQANRMQLRIKTGGKKNIAAHTLNGSALALPRILAALLEQNFNGSSFKIPDVLKPYLRFTEISS